MTDTKTFGAFLRQAAKAGIDIAQAVVPYSEKFTDCRYHVERRIEADLKRGNIGRERADVLLSAVDKCADAWKRYAVIVDHCDTEDWADLGNGAHMRKTHKDSDICLTKVTQFRKQVTAAGVDVENPEPE